MAADTESNRAEEPADEPLVRLNKYLADNGIASRRKADELIAEGEVMVDGEIVTALGTKVNPVRQRVEVDGIVLKAEGQWHRYYLLYKPTGVVCTSDPREARKRAIDLIEDRRAGRIYTVGRLDEDSEGLILLTNDGDFSNLVAHPRYGVPKLYKVTVRGRVEDFQLQQLRAGVRLSEGKASFESVSLRKSSDRQSTLLVGLKEGKNRQIRRVFARVGHKVTNLARVRIGNLTDRGLKRGQWRPLTKDEIDELMRIARGEATVQTPSEERRRNAKRGWARGSKGSRGTASRRRRR
ncbi:MAG: pseudouridine synthase [Planctomycetota bacterium]